MYLYYATSGVESAQPLEGSLVAGAADPPLMMDGFVAMLSDARLLHMKGSRSKEAEQLFRTWASEESNCLSPIQLCFCAVVVEYGALCNRQRCVANGGGSAGERCDLRSYRARRSLSGCVPVKTIYW